VEVGAVADTEFTIELRDWLVAQVRFIDEKSKRIDEDIKNHSGYRCFEPTEQEEREQRNREIEYEALGRERDAYVAVWRKAMRELELDKFLKDVQEWLPQGQTRA
jgi:hypothetical protein